MEITLRHGSSQVALILDPRTPLVDVIIGGILIPKAQVDRGSSVNLMSKETMEHYQKTVEYVMS